jgi:hypothetical protein
MVYKGVQLKSKLQHGNLIGRSVTAPPLALSFRQLSLTAPHSRKETSARFFENFVIIFFKFYNTAEV